VKNVLVAMEPTPLLGSVLEIAFLTTERFNSYVEAIAVRTDVGDVGPIAEVYAPSRLPPPAKLGAEHARQVRQEFESFMQTRGGLKAADAGPQPLAYGWRNDATFSDVDVAAYARSFDVTVFARHALSDILDRQNAFQATLFESGRPTLIAPPTVPATFGERVLIHWNGSTETARTIALALPVLTQARSVLVLTLEGGVLQARAAPGSGWRLVEHLALHGVKATHKAAGLERHGPGETILTEAAAAGCDLIVKGAYTQSRFRQMMFGGATSHILAKSELPVLMAH
jgi:nucleotide-binding universal stress UspA family protein